MVQLSKGLLDLLLERIMGSNVSICSLLSNLTNDPAVPGYDVRYQVNFSWIRLKAVTMYRYARPNAQGFKDIRVGSGVQDAFTLHLPLF